VAGRAQEARARALRLLQVLQAPGAAAPRHGPCPAPASTRSISCWLQCAGEPGHASARPAPWRRRSSPSLRIGVAHQPR
jgi:hypothetical protein